MGGRDMEMEMEMERFGGARPDPKISAQIPIHPRHRFQNPLAPPSRFSDSESPPSPTLFSRHSPCIAPSYPPPPPLPFSLFSLSRLLPLLYKI